MPLFINLAAAAHVPRPSVDDRRSNHLPSPLTHGLKTMSDVRPNDPIPLDPPLIETLPIVQIGVLRVGESGSFTPFITLDSGVGIWRKGHIAYTNPIWAWFEGSGDHEYRQFRTRHCSSLRPLPRALPGATDRLGGRHMFTLRHVASHVPKYHF